MTDLDTGTPRVTVCIPAYDAAAFIGHTLRSVADQTMPDFRVLIAVEPKGAEETIAAMREFLADKRFTYYVNATNHGYALNVRGLLARVRTPYYAILPHDDMWHPEFLELLLNKLDDRPDASAAHGDWFTFGSLPGMHSPRVTDGPVFDRVLTWFLDGAYGWAWHGLMRSVSLDVPFPDNEFDGFAVEGEWSLHLLLRGSVLHEPRALYIKRGQPLDNPTAVSVGWINRTSADWMRQAMDLHTRHMLEPLAAIDIPRPQKRLLELAAEASMFSRRMLFYKPHYPVGAEQEQLAAELIGELEAEGSAVAQTILARLHVAVSRYEFRRGGRDAGLQHAEAALACDPNFAEGAIHLAHAYLVHRRVADALPWIRHAVILGPLSPTLALANAEVVRQLATTSASGTPPQPPRSVAV